MSAVLELCFHEENRQILGGCRTITGSLTNRLYQTQAKCSILVTSRQFNLTIEGINGQNLRANIRIDKQNRKILLPSGVGEICADGKLIGKYLAKGKIMLQDGTLVRVISDDAQRRFLWARAHGCSYIESNHYAYRRNALLVYGNMVLASFAGYYKKTSFLTPEDEKAAKLLSENCQWCILVLCLMQNLYGPDKGLYDEYKGAGTVEDDVVGQEIPNIPSCIRFSGKKYPILSIDPRDTLRGVSIWDTLLQFVSSKYQFTIGIPFYILTIFMIRLLCSFPCFPRKTAEIMLVSLWCFFLIFFVKFLILHKYSINYHFENQSDSPRYGEDYGTRSN